MKVFPGPLTEEDPLANLAEVLSLNSTPAALTLVLGNFAGLLAFWYNYQIRLYYKAYVILGSIVISSFYHMCQTQTSCFDIPLITWVSSDHVTATLLFAVQLLVVINIIEKPRPPSTVKKKVLLPRQQRPKVNAQLSLLQQWNEKNNAPSVLTNRRAPVRPAPDHVPESEAEIEAQYAKRRRPRYPDNMMQDQWGSASVYTVMLVIVLSVYLHPFSYATFINAFIAVVALAFIKVAVYDECLPTNINRARVHLPDLLLGAVLALIGLGCYVADSYVAYQWLHTLWHIFIYVADPFITAGITRTVDGWFSLTAWFHYHTCCCAPDCHWYTDDVMLQIELHDDANGKQGDALLDMETLIMMKNF